ncbi:MAG: SDR family oxidoreductase [Crocinitomicaceae bacterium]|nr:SDR family oxidoreductase [Crocinitomicaceae bacterium]
MKFFIVGASGLVGGSFVKHLKEKGHEVVGTHLTLPTDDTVYFDALDLDNPQNFDVKNYQPDVVVHCAALANVDYCEANEDESYEKTVSTAKNLVELCKQLNAGIVYTSTDYVFDGTSGPYVETDDVNPLSVYGKHKLLVEELIQKELPDNGIILRICGVYGDEIRGKNFIIRIINDVKDNREWTMNLPQDQYATPVWAMDVAGAAVLLAEDKKSGIYHIGSTDFMNRVQLAHKVLSYLPNHKCTVIGKNTNELGQAAARPLMSGHISEKFLSEYPDYRFSNVDDYMRYKTS